MEKIKLELAKIVGAPSATSWSGVHTFVPDDPKKLALRGKLLAVVSLESTQTGLETVALGREILARLHEEYFGNLEGGVLERLKSSLKKVSEEWPKTEITAGVILPAEGLNVLYLGIVGRGRVAIKREGSLIELLVGGGNGEVESGSGLVEAGDVLLLGNSSFFDIVGEGILKASLGLGNPQEMIESLAPIVLSRSGLTQAAAVICCLFPDESPEEIVPFTPEQPSETKEVTISPLERIRGKLPKIKRSFYLRRPRPDRGKNNLVFSVAVILLFLFFCSLVLGISKKRNIQRNAKFKMLISSSETKLNEAKRVVDLDSDLASSYLEEAQQLLRQAKKISSKNEELTFLEQEVEGLLGKTKKNYELGQLSPFFDLGLIRPGAKGFQAIRLKNQLAILDSALGAIYFLNLEKKSSGIFLDSRLAAAEKISFSDQGIYVLVKEGILKVNIEDKRILLIIPSDISWGKIVDLETFAGNLYLLDDQKKTIWQYPAVEGGFGSLKSWATFGVFLEGKPLDMAIDGSIWVLGDNGKILKFTRGGKVDFSLKGYPKQLDTVKLFYLDEESQNLYLVDSESKKVIIFAKDGQFKTSYQWSGDPQQPDLITVWEQEKKAFLIKEDLIFSFAINESFQ